MCVFKATGSAWHMCVFKTTVQAQAQVEVLVLLQAPSFRNVYKYRYGLDYHNVSNRLS